MKTVLVQLPLNETQKEKLLAAGEGCAFVFAEPGSVTDEQIAQAQILIGNLPPHRLAAAEKLELLQLNSAGAAEYTERGVLREGVLLTNATGAYGRSVAEHAFAVTLMLLKKLHQYRDNQRSVSWKDMGGVGSINGATVAVIGLGDIGLCYARMAKALGATVIGVKRRPGTCPESVDELYGTAALTEVLSRADVVFSILPGTRDTAYFYGPEHFRAMKNSAVFLNCGRGNAVASGVLYDALTQGEIAAASIDVTDPEPLPADSPLWGLENLLITPHVSGGYHMPVTLETIVDIAAYNLRAYLNGGELQNIVDFETGYKK